MEKALILSTVKSSLPSFNGSGISYNDVAKMFLTDGWTSYAGNTYQEGLRLSDKIAVTYNIGHGYARSFLNGVRLYRYEGGRTILIGERSFSNYFWSESAAESETAKLLEEYVKNQCRLMGQGIPDNNAVRDIVKILVDETIAGTKLLSIA